MGFLQKWLIGQPEQEKALTPVVQSTEAVVEEVKVQAVVVAKIVEKPAAVEVARKPEPPPPQPLACRHIQPFGVRSIEHQITLDGTTYCITAFDFNWLDSGWGTHAKVSIALPNRWQIASNMRLMLTWKGGACDRSDEMTGVFAQAGLKVSRRLIEACLWPISNQILEIERELKTFR